MRHKTTCCIRAKLVDHDGSDVASGEIVSKIDGVACHSDSLLNYAELGFSVQCALRGGFPRLTRDAKGRLQISVEVDANRKLTRAELAALRDDFEGQITDGIGAGCFDALSAAAGLSVEVHFPVQTRCVQQEGRAWKPTATTQRGNERRIAAVKKLVDAMDSGGDQSATQEFPGRSSATGPAAVTPGKRPNFKKLFRLLAKVERVQLFDQIKAELEAIGNRQKL